MGDALKAVAARIAAWAARNPQTTTLRSPTGARAAVLVPLFLGADEQVRVLLTKRAATLSSHAGEVAFPGGRVDPSDASETAAALREAHEEVGLPPEAVEVVALFPYAVGQKSLPVRPVVGLIPPDFRPAASPVEVAAVFHCPLERFLSADGHTAREIHFKRPAVGLGPGSVRLHSFACGEHTVFGLTAHFLIQVAKVAFGRDPAFEEQSPGAAARIGTVLLPRPDATAALDAAGQPRTGGEAAAAAEGAAAAGRTAEASDSGGAAAHVRRADAAASLSRETAAAGGGGGGGGVSSAAEGAGNSTAAGGTSPPSLPQGRRRVLEPGGAHQHPQQQLQRGKRPDSARDGAPVSHSRL